MNKIVIFGNSETCSPCLQLKKFLYEIGEDEYEFKDFAEKDKNIRLQYKSELMSYLEKGEVANIPMVLMNNHPKIVGFTEQTKSKILEYLEK